MKESELYNCIVGIQSGDAKAFELIYDSYSASLYGIVLKILQDDEVAQDVLQDAFVKIWKNCNSYEPQKGSFFTWMLNIARNTAIDKYRQMRKVSMRTIQNDGSSVDISDNAVHANAIDRIGLEELLKTLPEEQQEVIDYLYFKGFTQQETSDELNLPLGTVKTRSRSALKALGELFMVIGLMWK